MAGDVRAADVPEPVLDGRGLRVAVVAARFNSHVTTRLLRGARETLAELGVADGDVSLTWVPGAFEIPVAAQAWATSGRVDAVICLGCVIRGETSHYEHVAGQAAAGIMRVGLDTGLPVVFGVLTTEDLDQALARSTVDGDVASSTVDGDVASSTVEGDVAGGHNAGADGAQVAVEMATWLRAMA